MSDSDSSANQWLVKAFSEAAILMDALLEFHTGLSPFDRKLLTYYALATHSLPHAHRFPLAKLHGPTSTGKSTAARIAGLFAYRPLPFSARGLTMPAFRDKLTQAHGGTAIIEEGDAAWKGDMWFESLLADRYSRDTAKEGHKIPDGEGGFSTLENEYFGATIIHRRIPFADPAVESRTIKVRFRPVHGKTYGEIGPNWEAGWNEAPEVKGIQDLILDLPPVEQKESIAGRVWNTYAPVVAVARMLGDSQFEAELIQQMQGVNMALREAQATAELDGIAVRALVECAYRADALKTGEGIALRDIREAIFKNTGLTVNPSQLGAIFDDMGFQKKKSHGITKIFPTAATLVKACSELGIQDDWIDELRKKLEGGAGGNG